jgi:glycosyltransferase involved in cell wall biosynthesis
MQAASRPARAVRAIVRARNAFFRDADAFVAMSRLIADEFLAAGIERRKIAYIPHGVDTRRFRPAAAEERDGLRSRFALPRDGVVVGYTGRLLRGKGRETLVDAFAALAAREPRLHLHLVGSGAGQSLSVEDALRARVDAAGLASRVTWAGHVTNVEEHLRAADIFAFPSEFEGLGLSLVEAAASGLACVGTRTGGIVDVIRDGVSGLLFEPGDTRALADALGRLATDEPLRSRLGLAGRAHALRAFDEEDALERYRTLFSEVAAGARRKRVA